MTHAAHDEPSRFNVTIDMPPKKPRLSDAEMIQLATLLRLSAGQNMALIRFVEQLPEQL